MSVKPQPFRSEFGSGGPLEPALRWGCQRGDLWLRAPGSTTARGYSRVLLRSKDRPGSAFQGGADRSPRESPCRRSPRARRREQVAPAPLTNCGGSLSIAGFSVTLSKGPPPRWVVPPCTQPPPVGGSGAGRRSALSVATRQNLPSLPRRKWEADELRSFRVSDWSKTFLSFSSKLLTRFACFLHSLGFGCLARLGCRPSSSWPEPRQPGARRRVSPPSRPRRARGGAPPLTTGRLVREFRRPPAPGLGRMGRPAVSPACR